MRALSWKNTFSINLGICKPAREKNGISISRSYWSKTLIWISQLNCWFRACCIFALPFAVLASDVWTGTFCFRKTACHSRATLGKLVHLKKCWHCKSKPFPHMALLVVGQHRQPCPGTDSAASPPVPPDLGEDTGERGLHLVCPEKATPVLKF